MAGISRPQKPVTFPRAALFLLLLAGCAAFSFLIPWEEMGGPPPSRVQEPRNPRQDPPPSADRPETGSDADPVPVSRTRCIRGRVLSTAGIPVPGANVCILSEDRWDIPVSRTRTDEAGTFRLHLPSERGLALYLEASAKGLYTDQREIEIPDEGFPLEPVQFILGQPGSLAGRITLTGSGKAVEKVQVLVTGLNCIFFPHFRARTGADGTYGFAALKPGMYTVRILHPGTGFRRDDSDLLDLLVGNPEGTRIEIRAGQENRADFDIPEPKVPQLLQVMGRALDSFTGYPVAGVEISVVRSKNPVPVHTHTDMDGRFSLDRVPEDHTLAVKAEGYFSSYDTKRTGQTVTHSIMMTRFARICGRVVGPGLEPVAGARVCGLSYHTVTGDSGCFSLTIRPTRGKFHLSVQAEGYARTTVRREVDLGPDEEETGLLIRLGRGGTITGTIRDEGGAPLETPFSLQLQNRKTNQRFIQKGHTATDGVYASSCIAPGSYAVLLRAPGFQIEAFPGVVAVQEGDRLQGLDFSLRKGTVLHGRIVNGAGQGIPGATVHIHAKKLTRPMPGWNIYPPVSSSLEGHFEIPLVQEGVFQAHVRCRGYKRRNFHVRSGTDPVTLCLKPLIRLEGRVRYAASGNPVTAFRIKVIQHVNMDITCNFVDVEGRFTLEDLREGEYELSAFDGKGATTYTPVKIRIKGPAPPRPVELLLDRTATFTGSVHAPDGTPLPTARVALYPRDDQEGQPLFTGATDGKGRFRIRHVTPGAYTARAIHPMWTEVSSMKSFTRGETVQEEFFLARQGAVLHVFARDAKNRPVKGARITIYRMNGFLLHPDRMKYEQRYLAQKKLQPDLTYKVFYRSFTRTDGTGRMERRFLPSGRFHIKASAPGFQQAVVDVNLQAGLETPAVLTLLTGS